MISGMIIILGCWGCLYSIKHRLINTIIMIIKPDKAKIPYQLSNQSSLRDDDDKDWLDKGNTILIQGGN